VFGADTVELSRRFYGPGWKRRGLGKNVGLDLGLACLRNLRVGLQWLLWLRHVKPRRGRVWQGLGRIMPVRADRFEVVVRAIG